jgi:hypothetical protein
VPLKGSEGFTRPGPWLLEFLGELNINYETVRLLDETIDEVRTSSLLVSSYWR